MSAYFKNSIETYKDLIVRRYASDNDGINEIRVEVLVELHKEKFADFVKSVRAISEPESTFTNTFFPGGYWFEFFWDIETGEFVYRWKELPDDGKQY